MIYTVGITEGNCYEALPTSLAVDCAMSLSPSMRYYCHAHAATPMLAILECANLLRRAMVVKLTSKHVEANGTGNSFEKNLIKIKRIDQARDYAEKVVLQISLSECGWNVSKAARELGINRKTAMRLMAKHGIKREAAK